MTLSQAIEFIDNLVVTATNRHLKEVEIVVLTGAWEAKTYEQIASTCQYSLNYIKQAAAPRLWKLISEILSRSISKTNFRAVIEELHPSISMDVDNFALAFPTEFSTNTKKGKELVSNWYEKPEIFFYGRFTELKILNKWLIKDRCRLIAIVGMGGIGKTALSLRCARNLQHEFEFVIWRELNNSVTPENILVDLIQSTGNLSLANLPDDFESRIDLLVNNLRQHRCLVIFDTALAMFPNKYYERLLTRLEQKQHQSCLMLIAREKPRVITLLEGDDFPTRTLHLRGLGVDARDILRAKQLLDEDKWLDLIQIYRGNPFALKIVANTIKELFSGKVSTFLKQKTIIYGELNDLLDEQFELISALEEQILYWLAISHRPISLPQLRSQMVIPVTKAKLIEASESLFRNSLIESGIIAEEIVFCLEQPVIIQYIINLICDRLGQEILATGKNPQVEQLVILRILDLRPNLDHSDKKPDFSIIKLILDRLGEVYQDENLIEQQLVNILSCLPENSFLAIGYAKNNLELLLAELKFYFEPKIA